MVPDITGGPVSTAAWRLRQERDSTWRDIESPCTPGLLIDGQPSFGSAAVVRLGALVRLLADNDCPWRLLGPIGDNRRTPELPSLSWISQNGGRWLRKASPVACDRYRRRPHVASPVSLPLGMEVLDATRSRLMFQEERCTFLRWRVASVGTRPETRTRM
jgi:hypothetical protein